jgi:hypothetical protein
MEFKEGTLHMSHPSGDNSFLADELAKTITFSYAVQQCSRTIHSLHTRLCASQRLLCFHQTN